MLVYISEKFYVYILNIFIIYIYEYKYVNIFKIYTVCVHLYIDNKYTNYKNKNFYFGCDLIV